MRPSALPASILLAMLAVLTGCQSVEAKAYSLRELRNEDGSGKLEGRAMSDLRYLLASGLADVGVSSLEEQRVRTYDDPDGRALEVLLELAEMDDLDPVEAGMQVELFTWLAVDDRYVLARERCVLELGRIAERTGLSDPEPPPTEPAPEAEVAAAVEGVYAATAELIDRQGGEEAWIGLDDACDAVLALRLDRSGARRALRYVDELLASDGVEPEIFVPLTDLGAELQRTCIQRALFAALRDPHGQVRAAAQTALAPLSDSFRLIAFLNAIDDDDAEVQARWLDWVAEYGLPHPTHDELRRFGLDAPDDVSPEAARAEFERTLLVRVLEKTGPFNPGRVSAAACRAMARITDADFASLRFEDWAQWYRTRLDAEDARP